MRHGQNRVRIFILRIIAGIRRREGRLSVGIIDVSVHAGAPLAAPRLALAVLAVAGERRHIVIAHGAGQKGRIVLPVAGSCSVLPPGRIQAVFAAPAPVVPVGILAEIPVGVILIAFVQHRKNAADHAVVIVKGGPALLPRGACGFPAGFAASGRAFRVRGFRKRFRSLAPCRFRISAGLGRRLSIGLFPVTVVRVAFVRFRLCRGGFFRFGFMCRRSRRRAGRMFCRIFSQRHDRTFRNAFPLQGGLHRRGSGCGASGRFRRGNFYQGGLNCGAFGPVSGAAPFAGSAFGPGFLRLCFRSGIFRPVSPIRRVRRCARSGILGRISGRVRARARAAISHSGRFRTFGFWACPAARGFFGSLGVRFCRTLFAVRQKGRGVLVFFCLPLCFAFCLDFAFCLSGRGVLRLFGAAAPGFGGSFRRIRCSGGGNAPRRVRCRRFSFAAGHARAFAGAAYGFAFFGGIFLGGSRRVAAFCFGACFSLRGGCRFFTAPRRVLLGFSICSCSLIS